MSGQKSPTEYLVKGKHTHTCSMDATSVYSSGSGCSGSSRYFTGGRRRGEPHALALLCFAFFPFIWKLLKAATGRTLLEKLIDLLREIFNRKYHLENCINKARKH